MKKTLLSAIMLLSTMSLSQAQVLAPGDETLNVTFDNAGYCLATCCNGTIADLYYASGGNVDANSSTFVAGSHKKIVATSTIDAAATPMFIDIYANIGGNCTTARGHAGIDMSTNTKVRIKAKTVTGTATIQFYMAKFSLNLAMNGSSTYNINTGGASVIKEITISSTEQDYVFDYSGDADFMSWAGRTGIDMYGIIVKSGASAEVRISELEFGTSALVTASNNANIVNDQVSLFPNPAKGSFNVDMTAMNNSQSASVKVMNANGLVVKEFSTSNTTELISTEGMNKGIYMVQITSGNKIATKKIVVE